MNRPRASVPLSERAGTGSAGPETRGAISCISRCRLSLFNPFQQLKNVSWDSFGKVKYPWAELLM